MATRPTRQEIRVAGASEPISHYTDAVRFGDLLFVSGIAPFDSDGNVVGEGDVVAQTRQVLANLLDALRTVGADMGGERPRGHLRPTASKSCQRRFDDSPAPEDARPGNASEEAT